MTTSEIIALIDAEITTNGANGITGELLNSVLKTMSQSGGLILGENASIVSPPFAGLGGVVLTANDSVITGDSTDFLNADSGLDYFYILYVYYNSELFRFDIDTITDNITANFSSHYNLTIDPLAANDLGNQWNFATTDILPYYFYASTSTATTPTGGKGCLLFGFSNFNISSSGDSKAILIGVDNSAQASNDYILIGSGNTTAAGNCVVIGRNNSQSSGGDTVVLGKSNISVASNSIIIGGQNQTDAANNSNIIIGRGSTAAGNQAFILACINTIIPASSPQSGAIGCDQFTAPDNAVNCLFIGFRNQAATLPAIDGYTVLNKILGYGVPTFADQGAAAALPIGAIFKTATGDLKIKV